MLPINENNQPRVNKFVPVIDSHLHPTYPQQQQPPQTNTPSSLITGVYESDIQFAHISGSINTKSLLKKMTSESLHSHINTSSVEPDTLHHKLNPSHSNSMFGTESILSGHGDDSLSSSLIYSALKRNKPISQDRPSYSDTIDSKLSMTHHNPVAISSHHTDIFKSALYGHHERITQSANEALNSTPMKYLLIDDIEVSNMRAPMNNSSTHTPKLRDNRSGNIWQSSIYSHHQKISRVAEENIQSSGMKVLLSPTDSPERNHIDQMDKSEDIDVLRDYDVQKDSSCTKYSITFPPGPMGLELEVILVVITIQ